MTRILCALGSRSRGRQHGYGLVLQSIDMEDARKHQTFLTAKGKALMREVARLVRSDQQGGMKLRPADLTMMSESRRDIVRDQWLSRLVAGRKLDPEDVKLATHLVETFFRRTLR
jgi:DNA-binding MarR family transcriptional regulator